MCNCSQYFELTILCVTGNATVIPVKEIFTEKFKLLNQIYGDECTSCKQVNWNRFGTTTLIILKKFAKY